MALPEDVHVGDDVRICDGGPFRYGRVLDKGDIGAKVRDQNGIVSYPLIDKLMVEARVPR